MPRHRFTDTRDRIEKAAIRLFVEKGVAETSVRDIARAVGISEGVVKRRDRRHDGLEDKTKGHRPARTIEQILPDALANFR